ncbi:MAG TPA: phage tail tape measure protein, partial [Gallicola sp.]|nr:phage tail tape measure protein [Gallicola sp.]
MKNIEQKLKPINIKANTDSFKEFKDASGETYKTITNITNELGQQVSITQKMGEETGRTILTNYKKQREELQKINTEQSKYWSQRVKETVSAMTQKPDELAKMADYYRQLEVSSERLTTQTHKQSLAQKDLLTQIKSIRGKDSAFISEENLVRLDRLEKGINKLDPAHKNFTRGLNSAKSQLKSINADIGIYKKQVQDASKFTNIWGQSLFDAGKKFAGWMLVATLIMTPVRAFRQGIQDLKDIDTELINIAKVTEYTKNEMKELAQAAVQVGHEFGRTAQEYLQAVTEFARAGFGQQAEEYAKLSLLLQNVGDVTATVANETLLAANAGFQLEGSYESLLGVIDKFNNISNKNATTVTKMSDAMKVGASVFHSAGMSIDETVAIIGTATASTQRAGSEISRAWRTILMNIRQVADEEA